MSARQFAVGSGVDYGDGPDGQRVCRGAKQGRVSHQGRPGGTCRLFRILLDRGGYDDGGAYWGCGHSVFCARERVDGRDREWFVTAGAKRQAAEQLHLRFNGVQFHGVARSSYTPNNPSGIRITTRLEEKLRTRNWSIIAEHRGREIGCLDTEPRGTDARDIACIHVALAYRDSGVGTLMFGRALERARATGIRHLTCTSGNPRVVRLFRAAFGMDSAFTRTPPGTGSIPDDQEFVSRLMLNSEFSWSEAIRYLHGGQDKRVTCVGALDKR